MSINIGMPEITMISAGVVGTAGNTVAMWSFFSTALFLGFFRYAISLQEKTAQKRQLEENADQFKSAAFEFASMFKANPTSNSH